MLVQWNAYGQHDQSWLGSDKSVEIVCSSTLEITTKGEGRDGTCGERPCRVYNAYSASSAAARALPQRELCRISREAVSPTSRSSVVHVFRSVLCVLRQPFTHLLIFGRSVAPSPCWRRHRPSCPLSFFSSLLFQLAVAPV